MSVLLIGPEPPDHNGAVVVIPTGDYYAPPGNEIVIKRLHDDVHPPAQIVEGYGPGVSRIRRVGNPGYGVPVVTVEDRFLKHSQWYSWMPIPDVSVHPVPSATIKHVGIYGPDTQNDNYSTPTDFGNWRYHRMVADLDDYTAGTISAVADSAGASTAIRITTAGNHWLQDKMQVYVTGGDAQINNPPDATPYWAKLISATQFDLYTDRTLSTPKTGTGTYSQAGTVTAKAVSNSTPIILAGRIGQEAYELSHTQWQLGMVSGVSGTTAVILTLSVQIDHLIAEGEEVTVYGADSQINTSDSRRVYVSVVAWNQVALYTDKALTIPLTGSGTYAAGGIVYCCRFKMLVSNVEGCTAANGSWLCAPINKDAFQLVGSVGNGTYEDGTGGWKKVGKIHSIANVSGALRIKSFGHTADTLHIVTIAGWTGSSAPNGGFYAKRIDADHFELMTSYDNPSWPASGITWTDPSGYFTFDEFMDKWAGVDLYSTGGEIHDVHFAWIAGTAALVRRGLVDWGWPQSGGTAGWGNEKGMVEDVIINGAHRGLDIRIGDGTVKGQVDMKGLRDWGMRQWDSESFQFNGNLHAYGTNSGSPRENPCRQVWLRDLGSGHMGTVLYLETGDQGLYLNNCQGCEIEGIQSHSIINGVIVLKNSSTYNTFKAVQISWNLNEVISIGPQIQIGPGCLGNKFLHGSSNVGSSIVPAFSISDGRGLRILEWHFVLNNNCTAIQFNSDMGDGKLNDAIIRISMQGNFTQDEGTVGIDLLTNLPLGGNNRIYITNGQHTGAGTVWAPDVVTPVLLPGTWDDVSNYIEVDGVQLTSP